MMVGGGGGGGWWGVVGGGGGWGDECNQSSEKLIGTLYMCSYTTVYMRYDITIQLPNRTELKYSKMKRNRRAKGKRKSKERKNKN